LAAIVEWAASLQCRQPAGNLFANVFCQRIRHPGPGSRDLHAGSPRRLLPRIIRAPLCLFEYAPP